MELKVTVELQETTKDGTVESNVIKKFINIQDGTGIDDILSLIPVAMSHAAFQIVDKLKEGIE